MGSKKLRKHKSRKAAIYKGIECLNCGCPLNLSDKYCPDCSQLNSTKQLSISDFFNEFFSSLFTYDSRLRHTLKDLLFKPGVITRNYVAGQRLKYANPFRFYLSVSIIYFILQGFSTNNDSTMVVVNDKPINKDLFLSEISKDPDLNYFNADSLNQRIDSIIKDSKIKNVEKEKTRDTAHSYLSEKKLDTMHVAKRLVKRFSTYQEFYENTKIKNPEVALDSLKHHKTKFNKWLYSKNNVMEKIEKNPNAFLTYMSGKIPFFLFFFAPFFALFFWILYSLKTYSYTEHLIFIFHIFSFVFLVGVITYLPDFLLGGSKVITGIIYFLIGPFYFYKAIRNFYKQNRVVSIFKFIVLNIIFFIGISITSILFFAATAAVY